jgi:hypothetical protein
VYLSRTTQQRRYILSSGLVLSLSSAFTLLLAVLPETLSTLRFACRAKKVQNRAVLSSDPRDALIMSLQREVLAMKRLLQQTQGTTSILLYSPPSLCAVLIGYVVQRPRRRSRKIRTR